MEEEDNSISTLGSVENSQKLSSSFFFPSFLGFWGNLCDEEVGKTLQDFGFFKDNF